MISTNGNERCVGCGPSLDWRQVSFHEPVPQRKWFNLVPGWRLIEAIEVQMTGNVPHDAEPT